MINWQSLFYNLCNQKSTVIQFPYILQNIYPTEYEFQDKELRAWRAMFFACECINITLVSKKELFIEFWSKVSNPTADRELLKSFYENNLMQLNKKISAPVPEPQPNLQDITFWDIFRETLLLNKRGSDDKDNVKMSSYHVDPKTELPILYLSDNKSELWKKFSETYPNSMKRNNFIARLSNSTNLKYRENLG
ncbi:15598_t:CDS:2, partial [Racocetra persica]